MSEFSGKGPASRYLKGKYDLKPSIFGDISMEKGEIFKRKLIADHTYDELKAIKTSINVQTSSGQSLGVIMAIISLFFSTALMPLTFYLQQSVKPIDWWHETKMMLYKENIGEEKDLEKLVTFLSKDILKDQASLLDDLRGGLQNLNITLGVILGVAFAIIFVCLYIKKWNKYISAYVNGAFEEVEERRSKRKVMNRGFKR
ncbi:hypothetical protein D3C74_190700 [compost metagenome]